MLIVEAAELLEHFQWLSEAESDALTTEKRRGVELELADVLIYLVRLVDRLDVNLLAATNGRLRSTRSIRLIERREIARNPVNANGPLQKFIQTRT